MGQTHIMAICVGYDTQREAWFATMLGHTTPDNGLQRPVARDLVVNCDAETALQTAHVAAEARDEKPGVFFDSYIVGAVPLSAGGPDNMPDDEPPDLPDISGLLDNAHTVVLRLPDYVPTAAQRYEVVWVNASGHNAATSRARWYVSNKEPRVADAGDIEAVAVFEGWHTRVDIED